MRLAQREVLRLAALFCSGCLLSVSLPAQPATNLPASTQASPTAARALLTNPPAPPAPGPALPAAKSPIAFFRELLAMTSAGRDQALTNRSQEARKLILAKVREYESLKPDERELRLSVTELRWYLRPLMTGAATNRPAQMASIPEPYRKLVEDRLREWDRLPLEVQKDLLENEAVLAYFAEIKGRSDDDRREMLTNLTPARREMLEKGISRWAAMSEDQRRTTLSRFNQVFELSPEEKAKALKTLPEPERRQIEQSLQKFGSLSPEQREQFLRSFTKYAGLSLVERQQFLKDAERWKQMSPGEQQAWRELVKRLRPPVPPVPPPRPPSLARSRPGQPVVTNGN